MENAKRLSKIAQDVAGRTLGDINEEICDLRKSDEELDKEFAQVLAEVIYRLTEDLMVELS